MSDIICVTNKNLCADDFLNRIDGIAQAGVKAVILREKELCEEEYFSLAREVKRICDQRGVTFIPHSFTTTAKNLGCNALHIPLGALKELDEIEKTHFDILGTSVHSVDDALKAQSLGCTYLVAGHIFETDCKKGLVGRGLNFLGEVCRAVDIPVYAIGGINEKNIGSVRNAGACGVCVMSSLMCAEDVRGYLRELNNG
ncbi:MAG: thiamine phosphate synthase [Eubacteriales bacterium]